MLRDESECAERDILRNDRIGKVAAEWEQRISLSQRRLLILRSILWEVLEWGKGAREIEEWSQLAARIEDELNEPELALMPIPMP